jgi:hypothetical protein
VARLAVYLSKDRVEAMLFATYETLKLINNVQDRLEKERTPKMAA